ncbi:MAG: hypothetical protein V8Q54_06740 [Alistipes senegalensis]
MLVTVQGTYKEKTRLERRHCCRWKVKIPDDGRGARGSHSTPIFDLRDGREQFMYGDASFLFDTGEQLFMSTATPGTNIPTWCNPGGTRSRDGGASSPRAQGRRRQAAARRDVRPDGAPALGDRRAQRPLSPRLGRQFRSRGERIAMAGRYPFKGEAVPPKGCVGKTYDARTGEEVKIDFPIKGMVIDFNGDGIHELYTDGTLYDRTVDRQSYDRQRHPRRCEKGAAAGGRTDRRGEAATAASSSGPTATPEETRPGRHRCLPRQRPPVVRRLRTPLSRTQFLKP